MLFDGYQSALALAALPAILGAYFFFARAQHRFGIILLLIAAFCLRLLMIHIDPFIHEWDERFHALVAKNMMDAPLTPMLFKKHIMAYSLEDWGYNHIWVHKQPLFLWQMAASMKIFGVHPWALRLPSAILGTLAVFCIYDMGSRWTKSTAAGFIAALLATFSNYTLELTSGRVSLDHNDLVFVCYMTFAYWAFIRYVTNGQQWKWAILVGVFAGLAILNKWLVGLLMFGGWGLYMLLSSREKTTHTHKALLKFAVSIAVACIIFIPWQAYIKSAFPAESAVAFAYNWKHITNDLGHPGNILTHIKFLPTAYSYLILVFIAIGWLIVLLDKQIDKKLTLSIAAMILVVFGFFSIFVATKMPAFVYVVSPFLLIAAAFAISVIIKLLTDHFDIPAKQRAFVFSAIAIVLCWNALKPLEIVSNRNAGNDYRNKKIHNQEIFKHIPDSVAQDYVILNCRPYENIELMFYKNALAYHWYPPAETIDSLERLGYKFAAFDYPNDQQALPEWIRGDSSIVILPQSPK